MVEGIEDRPKTSQRSRDTPGIHALGDKADLPMRCIRNSVKCATVRKPVCQRNVRAQASGCQRRLQRYDRATTSRAKVENLARPGLSQSLRQYRDNRAMQPQS